MVEIVDAIKEISYQSVRVIDSEKRRRKRKSGHSALNLNETPIPQAIWQLFFPLALAMGISSTVGLLDMYVAGKIGSAAQAAVGLGDQLIFLVIVLGTGISTACSAFVSRFTGARNYRAVVEYSQKSLLVATILGSIATLVGFCLAEPILKSMGAKNDVLLLAVPYAKYSSLANLPFVLSLCFAAIFRAQGETKRSASILIITALTSNVLCFVFFFLMSIHSLFALAYSWIIGASAGCLLGYCEYRRSISKLAREPNSVSETAQIKKEAMKELLDLGIPAILSELAMVFSQLLIYRMLSELPQSEALQAAWTVKLKIEELIALIPLIAFSSSTAVLVGQSLGAKMTERAGKIVQLALVLAVTAMLIIGTMLTLNAEFIANRLCSRAEIALLTNQFLAPSVILLPLSAASSTLVAALEGAGLIKIPMIMNYFFQVFGKYQFSAHLNHLRPSKLEGIGFGLCLAQILMLISVLVYGKKVLPRLRKNTASIQPK